MERNVEFLKLARRARTKWILDALDMTSLAQATTNTTNTKNTIDKKNIPGIECIQNTLDYLTDIIDDGSIISVDSLLLGLNDSDDINDNDDNNYYNNDNWSPYLQFIAKLRHHSSKDIVKSMQQFVAKFEGKYKLELASKSVFSNDKLDDTLDATQIWNFIDHVLAEMKLLPIFKPTTTNNNITTTNNDNDNIWEITKECCERFIFSKLYNTIFDNDYDDKILNEKLRVRIESLSFLSPEHLDIKSLSNNDDLNCLSIAINEIKQLNDKRSPIEKIECIKKCSIAIGNVLKGNNNRKEGLPGADEFLPILILTIAKSNPNNLHSNLKFLQKYTNPSKLVSEIGYLLTHFICAAHFLDNVDANALTISPSEFEKSITNCKAIGELNINDLKNNNDNDNNNNNNNSNNKKTDNNNCSNNKKATTLTLEKMTKIIPEISIKEYIEKRKQFLKNSSKRSI